MSMPISLKRSFFLLALGCALPVFANPVLVGPPPMVDGKLVPMPTVKKYGQYWYPASLVGFSRGLSFSFDHATNTLYVDGSRLDLDTLVVDGVVYIPLQPIPNTENMRPGISMLEARRQKYVEMEAGMPEKVGNTDMLMMQTDLDMPNHPWAEGMPDIPTGPVINLDPTGTSHIPAHLQTQPTSPVPASLPGRIPRYPTPAPQELPSPSPSPSSQAIPLRVATQGGPQSGERGVSDGPQLATQTVSAPVLPAPVEVAPAAAPTTSASGGGATVLAPSKSKNQAFEVSVISGGVKDNSSDRLLTLKLHQKNLSPVAQANLGTFALRCEDGTRIEPVQSRSVLPQGTLAPGGVREGELLFRLTPNVAPRALELEGTLPLSVTLTL